MEIEKDTKFTLTITNSDTGEIMVEHKDIIAGTGTFLKAGFGFEGDYAGGEAQNILFGELSLMALCYFKIKNLIRESLIKQFGESKIEELDKIDPYKE